MDSAVSTAARALAAGAPLEALKWVALRNDPPALALRGIAMAQLGELTRARTLLRRAARGFTNAEPSARARVVVAHAEVSLALRDLLGAGRGLEDAAALLARRGDAENALFAHLVQARRLMLLGEVDAAQRVLRRLELDGAPARHAAVARLTAADLALRRVDSEAAERSLAAARHAAERAHIPALLAEVARLERQLHEPLARLVRGGHERLLRLRDVEALRHERALVVDACRREARSKHRTLALATRPVLFQLLVALAEASPGEVPRDVLIVRAFAARRSNDSHRVRLRVELGRLRKLLAGLARIEATPGGFRLAPSGGAAAVLLLPPGEGAASALVALLGSGDAWATSALAAALGRSQRAVQRALVALERAGRVRGMGKGRARRWVLEPAAGFATTLLLVAPGTLG